MASPAILSFVMIAAILNGFLAGGNIDRMVVQMPAWRRIGPRSWAEYSRKADLGNGLCLYPFEAIGGAIFSIAAAILVYFQIAGTRTGMLPAGLGGIFAIGGLLLTLKAAPIMLSLRKTDDEAGLGKAFRGFDQWGFWRGILQVLAFGANLWTLVALLK